jgi:type I restriction enzyme S subunit
LQQLRQSILKWAFEGKLVDQEPADEPASLLLERIKAERAAAAASDKVNSGRRKPPRAKVAKTA